MTDLEQANAQGSPLPYLDKALPEAWTAASAFAAVVSQQAALHGLTPAESEIVKVRVSQLNECVFCLDLHSRQARKLGVPQQKLDLLPAWREAMLFSDRERALLAVAEIATELPLSEEGKEELVAARDLLGQEAFVSAEWVAASINMFNRISILSDHAVRPRDAEGNLA